MNTVSRREHDRPAAGVALLAIVGRGAVSLPQIGHPEAILMSGDGEHGSLLVRSTLNCYRDGAVPQTDDMSHKETFAL